MITPGLLSSLHTLKEILDSRDIREARGYLDSIIASVEAVQEHELQRKALLSARSVLRAVVASGEDDSEASEASRKFDAEVEQIVQDIDTVLKLKGLLQ